MSNLEHLIENGLITMARCNGYDDWHSHIADDTNWYGVRVSIEDLWTICQYVIYTWCPMRCEECKGSDCVECKHRNSDVCNECKRSWVHKDDKFELNLYTDTFGNVEEAFKQCEEFIENSTPEELQSYEDSLGINPDDYKYISRNEWDRLWRWAERNRV